MTTIPEDIMQAARTAYESMHPDYPNDWEIEIIARAILAERERCAKVAEAFRKSTAYLVGDNDTIVAALANVEAAIRGGRHE